jgi:hypothetical protein
MEHCMYRSIVVGLLLIAASTVSEAQRPRTGSSARTKPAPTTFFRIKGITLHPFNTGHEWINDDEKVLPPPSSPIDGFKPWAPRSIGDTVRVHTGPVLVLVELDVGRPPNYDAWSADESELTVAINNPDNPKPGSLAARLVSKQVIPLQAFAAERLMSVDNSGFTPPMPRTYMPFIFYRFMSCSGYYEITASITPKAGAPVTSRFKVAYPLSEPCD